MVNLKVIFNYNEKGFRWEELQNDIPEIRKSNSQTANTGLLEKTDIVDLEKDIVDLSSLSPVHSSLTSCVPPSAALLNSVQFWDCEITSQPTGIQEKNSKTVLQFISVLCQTKTFNIKILSKGTGNFKAT